MDVTCNVIEDLLPLYADGICSEDSKTIVEHHIAICPECKAKFEAMTAKLETSKPAHTSENPFKKARTHYIRLIAVTLCICVIIAVPAIICTVLTVNETLERNISWSTIRLDRDLKKLGKMIENGEYRKALDRIRIPNLEGYSSAEASAFKDMFAEDLKNYFDQHPIQDFKTYALYNHNSKLGDTIVSSNLNGYLHLEIKDESAPESSPPVYEFIFKSNDMILEDNHFNYGEFDSFTLNWATDRATSDYYDDTETYLYYYFGSPDMAIVPADFSERYFQSLDPDTSDDWLSYRMNFFSYDYVVDNWTLEGFYDKEEKHKEAVRNFIDEYAYYGCKTGKTEYIRDEIFYYLDRYGIQHVTLSFLTGNELITVDCDVPYSMRHYPYRLSAVRNIVYSDNAPEDFKTRFESIFAQ